MSTAPATLEVTETDLLQREVDRLRNRLRHLAGLAGLMATAPADTTPEEHLRAFHFLSTTATAALEQP